MHSPVDDTVSVANARVIFEAVRHPKSFVAIDGANHLLANKGDAAHVAGIIGQSARRYALAPAAEADVRSALGLPTRHVRVAQVTADGFAQAITAGRHELIADDSQVRQPQGVAARARQRGSRPLTFSRERL